MGKIITFWSPYKGKAGVTSCMCAVSAMFGMLHPELEIAISHLGQEEDLFSLYQEGQISEEGKKELSGRTGVAALKLNYMQAALNSERIRRCAIPMLLDNMYLFPGMEERNKQLHCQILGEKLAGEFDVTFLDLQSGENEEAMWLMKKADLAVLVLPQSIRAWNVFFQKYHAPIDSEKTVTLLGKYMSASKYSEKYFMNARTYKGRAKVIGCVPLNAGFLDAMEEGRTLEFCLRNEHIRRDEESYEFIKYAREAAHRLGEKLYL